MISVVSCKFIPAALVLLFKNKTFILPDLKYSKFFWIVLTDPLISTNKILFYFKILEIILKDSCSSENTKNLPSVLFLIISIIFSGFEKSV